MNEKEQQRHKTVLLGEAISALNIQRGDIVVDATLGAGGHTLEMTRRVGNSGKVVSFDWDKEAIERFIEENEFTVVAERDNGEIKIIKEKSLILVRSNFKNITKVIKGLYSIGDLNKDRVDGVLADLGWRIEQVEDKKYGMSFREEAPLNMRFDLEGGGITAREIVNEWSVEELKSIFWELGEEGFAEQIAQAIERERKSKSIETTKELADLIARVKKEKRGKLNPATKVFQALRIAVNEELSNLQIFLEQSFDVLESKGRLVIISFHSLEDRLVKNFFRAKARGCVCPKEIPVCVCGQKKEGKSFRIIRAGEEELRNNRRARSAILRVLEKV